MLVPSWTAPCGRWGRYRARPGELRRPVPGPLEIVLGARTCRNKCAAAQRRSGAQRVPTCPLAGARAFT